MRRWMLRLLGVLLLATAALCGWVFWALYHPLSLPATGVTVPIRQGASVDASIRSLQRHGLLSSPLVFHLYWRALGRPPLHAGLYIFHRGATLSGVLSALREGRSQPLNFTIVPGATLRQVYQQLQHSPYLELQGLPPASQLAAHLSSLCADRKSAEGCLLPQSYRYVPGEPALQVLQQAAQALQQQLRVAWPKRATDLPVQNPYQALILASIVQREGAPASQQQRIAAVFLNRLRAGMPLQSDPTVIYALGKDYDGHLQPQQMRVQSPYNTYLHPGLPPSPIAMPSLQALEAVLHPAPSDDLYFIAKGAEYHYSKGYAEHQQQIQRYLQTGRTP